MTCNIFLHCDAIWVQYALARSAKVTRITLDVSPSKSQIWEDVKILQLEAHANKDVNLV
jgi:hypothetical protein